MALGFASRLGGAARGGGRLPRPATLRRIGRAAAVVALVALVVSAGVHFRYGHGGLGPDGMGLWAFLALHPAYGVAAGLLATALWLVRSPSARRRVSAP